MPTTPIEPAAEILGYKLEKRIGSGGFGEVWAVEAPGGLKKALKIVYGFHDEKRAQAELKALDRVKSLRHPFLLSLERIEVFEGQLVVVTELADASLADRFNEYVAQGEPGIPRDEMLRYMMNAAEALDFLSIEKSLQHLDVKPENMLLVGTHAKVADFGLMKDLKAASQSLMQGMTPAYAAPELFDGNPAPSSDQYSLAIMYCEMIAGVRPFPGTTPAQLAAQHVHGKPNLRPIPRSDHAAVARALSKDPKVRYPSCIAFVEDLKKQRRTVRIARKRTETKISAGGDTLIYDSNQNGVRDLTEMISDGALPFQANSLVSVVPPTCDGSKAKVHPAIIISVGNTANKIGQKFKKKLLMRTGVDEATPSIRSVFIDSDRKELASLENGNNGVISASEAIEIPLRKAEDYRASADQHFGWLSRRWIYNVPRTLQTEGLRPLGRLVFADHFSKICEQLETVIDEFSREENLAKTADTLNLDPGKVDEPRVYIISSISGGIGSGMTLDLAYTVKLLLAEKGLKHDCVTGILVHSTYQRTRDPGLSAANAFAFLTEMRHFNEHGYPGDANLGIPEFDDDAPFQQTYFTELGDDLNQSDFDKRLDSIAEYVSLSLTTPCVEFFESCREREMEMDHFALRTMGLATAAAGDDSQRDRLVGQLCQKLVQRWNSVGAGPENDPETTANRILSELKVSGESVERLVHAEVIRARGLTSGQVLAEAKARAGDLHQVAAMMQGIYGDGSTQSIIQPKPLMQAMDEFLTSHPLSGQSVISKACYKLLGRESLFLGAVEATAATLRHRIGAWSKANSEEIATARQNIKTLMQALSTLPPVGQDPAVEQTRANYLTNLCSECEREFVKRITGEFFGIILNDLQPVDTVVGQLKTNLQMTGGEFVSEDTGFDLENGESAFDAQCLMIKQVESKLDEMAEQVERHVYGSLIEPEGGYQHALTDYSILRYNLPNELRTAAQQAICHFYESLSIEDMIRENDLVPEQLFLWMSGLINDAKPLVNDCGGQMKLMIAMPLRSGESRISNLVEMNCKLQNVTINGTDGKVVVCFEADDVSLAAVAFRLLAKRPDAVELVKRIHTRSDINWTTLDDLL